MFVWRWASVGSPVQPKSANTAGALGSKNGGHKFCQITKPFGFLDFCVLRGVTDLGFLAGGVLEVFVGSLDVVQVDISGFLLVKVANLSQSSEVLISVRLVLPDVSCCLR